VRAGETRAKIGGWPVAAGVAVVLVFLFFIRQILLPFILAAALAFLLTPVVDDLCRRSRLPRWAAAGTIYLLVLLAFALLAYFVGGPLIRDIADLIETLPQGVRKLISEGARLVQGVVGHQISPDTLADAVLGELRGFLGGSAIVSMASYGVAIVVGAVLFVVLLIYFLISGRTIAQGTLWLVPPEYRREVNAVSEKVLPLLWRYFLGLAIVVLYTSTAAWVGFGLVFHLPRAPLLAVVVGLLELVPLIGPAASIGIVLLTALQQAGLLAVLGLVGFAVALRLSIDQLVGPLVLGQAARLHPVVIIFSFLSGAVLFGVIGILLAVPVAASIKIVLTTYYAEPVVEPAAAGSNRRPASMT
jgi:predicted PurR-regulated permease PerM